MREILFRGKPAGDAAWVEGDLFRDIDNFGEHRTRIAQILGKGRWQTVFVDPETICQYTGLQDKNGRKIFEGDIVRRTDLHTTKEPSVGFIEYDAENTAFLIHWTDILNYSATFPWKERIEVVGNIFDNPELMGK